MKRGALGQDGTKPPDTSPSGSICIYSEVKTLEDRLAIRLLDVGHSSRREFSLLWFAAEDGPVARRMEVVSVLTDLRARGLIAQTSDLAALERHLAAAPRTLYCGFDPTAESLHVGNLVPLLALRRFQLAGHRPILLVGGATGLIGDPSGRSSERRLNDASTVSSWVERIRGQVAPFLDLEGPAAAVIVDNLEWTQEVRLIDFLRDIGKHFSVNAMIQRDSVRSRLERDGDGISFTEFSYMLLQAMDYLHLAQNYDCSLQIGGSDQWGNIVSGMDLVRRKLQRESHALTLPLVTKSDGTKFGKSASGAVWLDANKTSAYGLYQFFVNTADADVERFMGYFTFMDRALISKVMDEHRVAPEQRIAQRILAHEITQLVHGAAAVESAERITEALFEGDLDGLGVGDLRQLAQDGVPVVRTNGAEFGLLEALVGVGLAPSNSAARRLVASGAVRINGHVCIEPTLVLRRDEGLHGGYFLIRRGKRDWGMVDQAG